jgi:hypothetical protein
MTQTADAPDLAQTAGGPKQQVLLSLHQICWSEMTWRRNAGYRTVILGLGYCGVLLTVVACNPHMLQPIRICLAAVIALATLFGAGYLTSNYKKYMAAAARMIRIEDYLGAFDANYLGALGPLMPAARRTMPDVPLLRDPVCLWSVIAFAAGGLLTAAAILLV